MKKDQREKERIEALKNYSILDTLPEPDFDNITALASAICGTTVSLISLVDEDRQWFKSKVGTEIKGTPRNQSFCAHAIEEKEQLFIIEDARVDPRFKDNPLVTTNPKIVFYAGMPLVDPQGNALGTICVIDGEKKKLNDSQVIALQTLAKQTINLFELRKKTRELSGALTQLKLKSQSLEKFAYTAAHDIRSPLANMSTLLGLFTEESLKKLNNEEKEILEHVMTCSNSLNEFVKGLLEYNRSDFLISEARSTFSINGLLLSLRPRYSISEKVEFEFKNSLDKIFSLKIALEQIFMNLFDNAIKYNDKEVCKIVVKSFIRDGEQVIQVSDNGPGMPPNASEKLFEIFETGPNLDNKGRKGSGIGLATVKKLVNILDGEIKIHENVPVGTVFEFTIGK